MLSAFLAAGMVSGITLRPPAAAVDSGIAWVAGGWFTMGSETPDLDYARRLCVQERLPGALRLRGCADETLFADEAGAARVYVSAYGLDRREVSRSDYHACVAAGACTPAHMTSGHLGISEAEHPVAAVTWRQARDVCAFRGGRLPTEAEWERGARGDSARRFPWGRNYNERLANHGGPDMAMDPLRGRPVAEDGFLHAAPVGSFPLGASPFGVLDMAGNVWEWTADGYAPHSELEDVVDPRGAGENGLRVVKGGSWRSPGFTLRVTHRSARPEAGQWVDVGVRCAYDLGLPGVGD